MSKAKWSSQEDDYLMENYLTKHISCVVRGLWSLPTHRRRLPKDIAARYAILCAEAVIVTGGCPTCGAPESDIQKSYTSLHCYTVAYDCGYGIVKALSDASFISVSVNCGGEPVRPLLDKTLLFTTAQMNSHSAADDAAEKVHPRINFNTDAPLNALQALAESWASIDGRTPIYTTKGLEEGWTYPDGKPVTYDSMNDHADGYEAEAHEMIKRLEKRGYKIVPN